MNKAMAAALLLALPAQGVAAQTCLTRAEATDLVVYLMPVVVRGIADKCAATLPDTAFLNSGSAAFVERLGGESDRRWPGARAAFMKMAGRDLPVDAGDDMLRPLLTGAVSNALLNKIGTRGCVSADELLGAIAPLPAQNIGTLLTGFLRLATESGRTANLAICPDD
ncbi:hypothetical protein [Sphingomonas quercus]|uniref:Uncharacterized protein n=1 Tax=Sphingomonas quercus TaxID=2842451 RepID=A0ABS6BFM4_9SPHN|nr:hypothetical protein [Sphingomonas quercus]MBU3077090.1 hypothetical protein [Sphingomonas quercus]